MLGEEGPGGQNQAAGRMHSIGWEKRGFSKLKPAGAAWVWSRRWIEGVRSATGRHRSRCRLRGPRQRVPEPEDGTGNAPDSRKETSHFSRGNSRHGVRGRDTRLRSFVLNTRDSCTLPVGHVLLTYLLMNTRDSLRLKLRRCARSCKSPPQRRFL